MAAKLELTELDAFRIGSAERSRIRGDHRRCDGGFALVISLVFMSFMLLVLLLLGSLTSVEMASVDQREPIKHARANAVLGLQVALGDLQTSLGPDTRISAQATLQEADPRDRDDFDATGGTSEPDGIEPARQQWTGVWDVSEDADGFPVTTFRRWLVSGEELEANADSLGHVQSGMTPMTDSVSLVGGGTATQVEAGLVSLPDDGKWEGGFGFWIGDEGVKAKVNVGIDSAYPEFSVPQRPGFVGLDEMSWLEGSLRQDLDSSLLYSDMDLISGTGGISMPDAYFHSFGFDSYGLLTNPLDGGLKRDLTTAFYDEPASLTGSLFPPASGGAATQQDPGGPDWSQLISWVDLQPNVASGALPVRESTGTQAGAYPIVTGFQLYVVPTYDPDGEIRFNMMPAVVLWNPYDVPLQDAMYTVSFAKSYMRNAFTFIDDEEALKNWINFQLRGQGGSIVMHKIDMEQSSSPADMRGPLRFYFNSGVIEPGQSVVFSPQQGHQEYSLPGDTNILLERGSRPGASLYFYPKFQVPIDSTTEIPPYDFRLWHDQGRVYSLKLSLGQSVSQEPLQTVVYLSTYTYSGPYSGLKPMSASPTGNAPLATTHAVGPKFMHTFVNNNPFWTGFYRGEPDTHKWLSHFNPRSRLLGPLPLVYGDSDYREFLTTVPDFASNFQFGDTEMQTSVTIPGAGYSGDAIDRAVLFQSAPERGELHSIGQLSHAPLYAEETDLEDAVRSGRFGNLIPAYAIGNSRAQPWIPLDSLALDWSGAYSPPLERFDFDGVSYDYSYLLNRALWDDYFLSTLPGDAGNLPENPRLSVFREGGLPPRSDVDVAAADLMVDGAFNVNSTSVAAWESLLSSFYEIEVPTELDGDVASDNTSPLPRVDQPLYGPVDDDNGSQPVDLDPESYAGYRALSPAQIHTLAESIVEEIKLRGPFGSLAQFVNRMPNQDANGEDSVDAFRLRGTLSAAIEKSGVNEGLQRDANLEVSPSGLAGIIEEAEAGWRTEDLPGWLSQIDILQRMGSLFAVRSDTFRIRSYGESVNPVSGNRATARCEAIVQRIPEYVDSDENAPESSLGTLSATNSNFGRRFVVLSFRWLNDDAL